MPEVLRLLKRFPGSQPVRFYFEETQKVLEVEREFWVDDGDELMNALQEVMDSQNVVWKLAKNFA